MIIERILNGPQTVTKSKSPTGDSRKALDAFVGASKGQATASSPVGSSIVEQPSYGVPVSTAASVRFERLKDRITLYALSEIQDCIDEKEALVMLVGSFNARIPLPLTSTRTSISSPSKIRRRLKG